MEAERKAEERRRREIAEEEVRRMNRSPARSRIPSAVNTPVRATATSPARNTPMRNKPNSPARLVIPRTPGASRVQVGEFAFCSKMINGNLDIYSFSLTLPPRLVRQVEDLQSSPELKNCMQKKLPAHLLNQYVI